MCRRGCGCILPCDEFDGEGITAYGDFSTTLNTLSWADKVFGINGDILHAGDGIIIVTWNDTSDVLHVSTHLVDTDGNIGARIDDLTIGGALTFLHRLVHISGEIYAVLYRPGGAGNIATFSVDSSGNISDTTIDTHQYVAAADCFSVIKVSESGGTVVLAIAAREIVVGLDGMIYTISMDDDGTDIADVGNVKFEEYVAYCTDIIHVTGTVYAVLDSAKPNGGYDAYLSTINIPDSGESPSVLDGPVYIHDISNYVGICHLTDTIYICFTGNGSYGRLVTRPIAADGTIGAEIASVNCGDGAYTRGTVIINAGQDPDDEKWVIMIIYQGAAVSQEGRAKTYKFTSAGAFDSYLDEITINESGWDIRGVHVHSKSDHRDIYATLKDDSSGESEIATFWMETPPAGPTHVIAGLPASVMAGLLLG